MKKFILSSDALKKALKKLGLAVNEKVHVQACRNVLFRVSKAQVVMITTDLDNVIAYTCPAESATDEEFELLLPFKFLHDIVTKYGTEPVTIEHPSDKKAKITIGNDLYEANSLDPLDQFPKLPATPKKPIYTFNADFVKLIGYALLTVAKEQTRPAMTRVLVDIRKDSPMIASTDAHVLYSHKLTMEVEEETKIQLSAKTVKAMEGMSKVEVSWTKDKVCLRDDTVTVWYKRNDDVFPDYRAIIPSYPFNLEVVKADITAAMEKALISNLNSRMVTMFLKKEKGQVLFETNDVDYGRKIKSKINGSYTGEVEAIAVNAEKMLTVLEQVEAETIRLHINQPSKAILISAETDENHLGLIMPLLLDK